MLDYLTAGIAFWMTWFGVQESLLEFRLSYLGHYWFLAISASLLLSFLLSAPIIITLIIKFAVDPFTWTGNVILSGIAAVIFGVIFSLVQWLILRQSEMTTLVFPLINTRPLADILKRSPIFKLVVIGCCFVTYWDRLAYHLQRVALRDWAMPHRKLGECEPIVRVPATLL